MIERTFDYRKIKKRVSWQPLISSKVIYLIDGEHGLWTLHEYGDGLMIHVDMSPHCRGKSAIIRSKAAISWVFDNTSVGKIVAGIPKTNQPCCYHARRVGMIFTHIDNEKRYYEITHASI